jgi:hypothetical protein
MKKGLFCVLVCMLLISTILLASGARIIQPNERNELSITKKLTLNGTLGMTWTTNKVNFTGYCITNSDMKIGRFVMEFPVEQHPEYHESGKGFFIGSFIFGRFGAIHKWEISIPWVLCIGHGNINDTHFSWEFWELGQKVILHSKYLISGTVLEEN